MNLGEVENFKLIEKVAKKVEKKRILTNMKLSKNEINIISEYILDYTSQHGNSLESLSKITGLSSPPLAKLRDKKNKNIRLKTYEVFKGIIEAQLTADAEAEEVAKTEAETAKAEGKTEIQNEFKVMSQIDALLSQLANEDEIRRVLEYFNRKHESLLVPEKIIEEEEN